MIYEFHLAGKYMSTRAVRVRGLEPIEAEQVLSDAAKIVGEEGTILELKKTQWRNGIKFMVVAISDPCEDPRKLDPKQWKKTTPQMLENLGDFFTPKDIGVLEAVYRDFHEVNPEELKAITGKALPVSEA